MMNSARTGGSVPGRPALEELRSTYRDEIAAARNDLSAEPTDLARLLVYIHGRQPARAQTLNLLKQAHSRLAKLREAHADLSALWQEAPETAALIERADEALRLGGILSLDEIEEAYEQAYGSCLALGAPADLIALLRARQAQLAAIMQDYRRAAGLYAEAAAIRGLDTRTRWRYEQERASILEALGREFVDNEALQQALALYEETVLPLAPRAERPGDWASTQHKLGRVLGILGQRHSGTKYLERAVQAFENAQSERSRERAPLDWAATQNSLGNALGALGQRQGDIEMLERSVEVFERALEERTSERSPKDWAQTQNNLAAVLQVLAARKKDSKLLKQSAEAYKRVLTVWTRERAPLEWAATLNNLGTVLRLQGEQRKGPRTLEQSVAAYNNALAERTRERVPQDWAMTQNNLGAALHRLGEREDDTDILARSVESYENALKEWTRDRMPMAWAMTMANLGVARRALAERSADAEVARRAMADLEAAVEFFREASHAQYNELAQEQLIEARRLAAALEQGGTQIASG